MTFMNLRLLPARAGAMTAGPIGKWRRVYSRGEGGDPQASKHNFQETHSLISAGHQRSAMLGGSDERRGDSVQRHRGPTD